MCGIAGWLGNIVDGQNCAKAMTQALHHRGPDTQGIKHWSKATLVHTRLSIIDLSQTGVQPMANEDGTVWTVFNGEIYNHHILRHDLESKGHIFKGRSDTEVLVHLYEEEGPEFVSKLRGMFAFAIFDVRTSFLMLARDRFGIKPLFYAPGQDFLAFGSEISALMKIPGLNMQPDRQAIFDFAALFFIPAPATFYKGIRALQPGEILEAQVDNHRVSWETRFFHKWVMNIDQSLTLEKASRQAGELLTSAVQRQLESDVPLGTLLSGGIDSSLISAMAQEALNGKLQTFNVRFPEKDFDETPFAQAVVDKIGSHHMILDMEEVNGTWERVQNLLLHAGQPFADTSLFAMNAICRLMKKHVKVVLSGDGGDEGFGGYDYYWWIKLIDRWQGLPGFVKSGSSGMLDLFSRMGIAPPRLPTRAFELNDCDDSSTIQYLFSWIREKEHSGLCRDTNLLPVKRHFEPTWQNDFPKKASRAQRLTCLATEMNVRLKLANDYLFKVDAASMKESLEVRVPFLDEDLFAFGLTLPHVLKSQGKTCKPVLRSVAQRMLPSKVTSKKKAGFVIPFDTWTDRNFKATLKEVLLDSSSRLDEYFRPESYRPVVRSFCEGSPMPELSQNGHWSRIVMLLSVNLALTHQSS